MVFVNPRTGKLWCLSIRERAANFIVRNSFCQRWVTGSVDASNDKELSRRAPSAVSTFKKEAISRAPFQENVTPPLSRWAAMAAAHGTCVCAQDGALRLMAWCKVRDSTLLTAEFGPFALRLHPASCFSGPRASGRLCREARSRLL